MYYDTIHSLLVWLRTGSYSVNVNRYRSHARKLFPTRLKIDFFMVNINQFEQKFYRNYREKLEKSYKSNFSFVGPEGPVRIKETNHLTLKINIDC